VKRILERDMEDWVCENIGKVCDDYRARFIARQVQLSARSRCDVVAVGPSDFPQYALTVFCVEVKRGKVRERDVGQLLRYMGLIGAASDYWPGEDWKRNGRPVWDVKVRGVMVAPAADTNAILAMHGAGCSFFRLDPDKGWAHDDYSTALDREIAAIETVDDWQLQRAAYLPFRAVLRDCREWVPDGTE
jgi:RecB family endonuclease NucS